MSSPKASYLLRGTQHTVSVNICSEDLLSPTIFGLKYDEKLELCSAQIFVDMKNVMPVDFGEIKMSLWVRKKDRKHFRKGNSSSYIRVIIFSFPRISEQIPRISEQMDFSYSV